MSACMVAAETAAPVQVLGNAKGVVAAIVSVALFKNPVSFVGCAGYLLTVAGVVGYSQVMQAFCCSSDLHLCTRTALMACQQPPWVTAGNSGPRPIV